MAKYNHYVGILQPDNRIKYVTSINNQNKVANWKSGEKAMKVGLHTAEDTVFGLTLNGYQAVVVKAPNYLELMNA